MRVELALRYTILVVISLLIFGCTTETPDKTFPMEAQDKKETESTIQDEVKDKTQQDAINNMRAVGGDTLVEKQTKTYTIGGRDYEVTLNFVDSDEAQFTINRQRTKKLKEGDVESTSIGIDIGITGILYQDFAGGTRSVDFLLGVQK